MEVTWLETHIAQYQFPDLFALPAIIDHADEHLEFYLPEVGGDGTSSYIEDRRSGDIAYLDHDAGYEEHAPVFDFAETIAQNYHIRHPAVYEEFPDLVVQEGYSILRYRPGEAYHALHADWGPSDDVMVERHLTFILFLNDVDSGGELEFPIHGIKVTPAAGKVVLFPATWTHQHRSLPATSDRYIFQFWWSYEKGHYMAEYDEEEE